VKRANPFTLALALVLLAGAAGCTTRAGRYGQSRLLDLFDAAPISLQSGPGLHAHVRVTEFLGIGAGYADVYCFGFDDARFGPYWYEEAYSIPLVSDIRHQSYPEDGDRWPGGHFEDKILHDRYRANTFVFVPGLAEDGGIWPPVGSEERDEWRYPRWAPWDRGRVEVGLVVIVAGARVGIAPLQAIDFLAGLAGFDPAGDDVGYNPQDHDRADEEPAIDAAEPATPAPDPTAPR
jgi:hypothetical protein